MLWRSVFACIVLCSIAEAQTPNRGSTKATVPPTVRSTVKTQTPVIRVNYKSVKRSSLAALTAQNDTTDGTNDSAKGSRNR
ncbi:hypothetical protein RUM43_002738 [Polyplax serrata]|uniref:Uncharacterized protein n=1 Tax=Polyplax serrata TaxID=468196 RepID=A0AAN8NZI9_POLSC